MFPVPPQTFIESSARIRPMEKLSSEVGTIHRMVERLDARPPDRFRGSLVYRRCRMIVGDDEVERQSGSSHDGDMPDDLTCKEVTAPTDTMSLPCLNSAATKHRSGTTAPDGLTPALAPGEHRSGLRNRTTAEPRSIADQADAAVGNTRPWGRCGADVAAPVMAAGATSVVDDMATARVRGTFHHRSLF